MDWSLIISIAGLVTGGGCIIWIFNAGRWMGVTDTKIGTLLKDQENESAEINSRVTTAINTSSVNAAVAYSDNLSKLRAEFSAMVSRVHERLDDRSGVLHTAVSEQKQLESRLDVLIAGMQTQRQEWDALRQDIRILLRSEATTSIEIVNFKTALHTLQQRFDAALERVARLDSEFSRLSERKR